MANQGYTVKFTGQFDTSQITKGIQDIKKQVTNANISEDLKKKFEEAFNKLQVNIPALEKLTSKEDFNLKDIQALQKLLKEVTKDWENLNKVTNQIDLSKTFSTKDLEKISNLDKQIKQTQENIQKARQELIDSFTKNNTIDTSSKNISDALTELFTVKPNEIESKFKEIQGHFIQGIQQTQTEFENKLKNANIQKTGGQLIEYFFGKDSGVDFANKVGPVKEQINDIIRKYREFAAANNEAKMAEQVQKLNQVLTDTANFKFPEGYKLFGLPTQEDLNTLNQIGRVLQKVRELAEGKKVFFTEEETKLAEQMAQKIQAESEAARNAEQSNNELKNSIKEVGNKFEDTSKKAENLSDNFNKQKAQTDALSATFSGLARRITNSISALTIFNRSIQIVRQAVTSVRELDAAFTQIAIVSEQSNEQAWQMFNSFNKLAKQYSITTKDLTEGAKLFYQQGLSAADTMKMVEASTVSAALGEVTMTEAANTLTAAIQGYNETAAVAMDYTDKIAMVGAVSAADFNELSTAMEKTASSAYTAGIDFDHLLGYLGKMIEVTREAPANLGTAMKTIIARFEDMKKDPMAILEDGVSANKVEAALATIGIALRNSEGEFRALQDVMDELGMKWSSLTRNQQAYIATVAAGSRQQSRFLALMNNYDRTLDLVAESQNSAGAAAQQYAVYQDSAAAATARLTAAWEEFYAKIVNSETIIFVINSLTKLVETMSKVGPVISTIGASIGALGLQTLIKGVLPKITTGIAEAAVAGKVATFSFSGLIKGGIALGASLGKLVLIIGAVAAAIAGSIWVYKKLDAIFHKDREEARQLSEEIKELNKTISNSDNKIKSLDNLLEKYDELSNKIYLTEEEQQELNDTIEQIQSVSDRAITYIDKMGKAHLANRDAIADELEQEKEAQAWRNEQLLKSQIEWIKNPASEKTVENLQNNGFVNMARVESTNRNPISEEILEESKKGIEELNSFTLTNSTALFRKYGNIIEEHSEDIFNEIIKSELFKDLDKTGIESIFDLEDNLLLNFNAEEYQKYNKLYFETVKKIIADVNGWNDNIKISEEYQKNYNEAMKEAEKQDYTNLALQYSQSQKYISPQSEILTTALQNGAFEFNTLDELLYFYDNFDKIVNNKEILKAFDDFNNGKIDSKKLQETLLEVETMLSNAVGEKLESDAEEAIKELEKRNNERRQFWRDNQSIIPKELIRKYILQSSPNIGISTEDAFMTDNYDLSSQDLDYLSTFFKLNLNENSKVSLFDFIKENEDDKFQTLMQKYINSLSKGITDESNELQQQIIDILTPIIPKEDIIKIINDFVPNYQELLEQKIDEDFSSYNTTRKGAADLTKLKSKERKSFLANNEDADKYFEYNEDGEEYLNILGKIVLLEQQRSQISKELNDEIQYNNNQISNNETQLEKVNEKLEKGLFTNEETEDSLRSQKETLEKNTEELEEANKLYQKQLDYINESTNLQEYEAMALQSNVNKAKEHADNIKAIAEAWAAYQQGTAESNLEAISTLNQLDASYQSLFMTVSNTGEEVFTLNQDIVDKMIANEQNEYQEWRKNEIQKLEDEKTLLEGRIQALEAWKNGNGLIYNEDLENKVETAQEGASGQVDAESKGYQKGVENATTFYQKLEEVAKQYFTDIKTWAENVYTNIMNPKNIALAASSIKLPTLDVDANINFKEFEGLELNEQNKELANKLIAQYQQRITIITATIAKLGDLSPEFQKTYDKAIKDANKGSKEAQKELEKLGKMVDKVADEIEKLDQLIIDLAKDLKDINVDYNPFTELFEAWEHEWDYYYNIKRLIDQLGKQGEIIDNVISADSSTADRRVQAYKAKIGNITGQMAANDAYILALRTGITQLGTELNSKYGDLFHFDYDTWQIYQKDTTTLEINDKINNVLKEQYDLREQLNDLENQQSKAEAHIEVLEKMNDAYEDIIDSLDSIIDEIDNNDELVGDTSQLKALKQRFKDAIDDGSIEGFKDALRELETQIKDLDVKIDIRENIMVEGWEDAVENAEELRDKIVDSMDTLNDLIVQQQELLQQASEVYNYYIETAISTEQTLYDAIVENYQNEIDKKKEQYNYLKQLDNDYLASVKDNINKERQAREDSKNQKSYQQSLQRLQLLQQDTSGAYRSEIAQLGQEIEDKRQELYDDLVDKQVDALETEINKRHELYDLEVAALEERLTYMQENAILLWEMVNGIVAEGADSMMATLESTADFIKSSETDQQRQRKQWERDIKITYEGVIKNEITILEEKIKKQKESVDELIEFTKAIDKNTATYEQSTQILIEENGSFQDAMDAFMTEWNRITNGFTGYYESWEDTVSSLKTSMDNNIEKLKEMGNPGGSILALDDSLRKSAEQIYNDYLNERQKYADELSGVIADIKKRIGDAVTDAAIAIRDAAASAQYVPKNSGGDNGGTTTQPTQTVALSNEVATTTQTTTTPKKYKIIIYGTDDYASYVNGIGESLGFVSSPDLNKVEELAKTQLIYKKGQKKFVWAGNAIPTYKKGGLSINTGLAWLDGTSSNPERILSPRQTKLFESMVHSLEKSTNSNINSSIGSSYNIGDINTTIQVDKLDNNTDINRLVKQVEEKIVKSIRNRVMVSI